MQRVLMLDLPMVPLAKVVIDEEQQRRVLEVLQSGVIAQGPMVEQLEDLVAEICSTQFAMAVSSGTTALELGLRAAGIGPGDEVITAPITFGATLNAILHTGASARFADISPDGTIAPDSVADLINPRTAAILPVHLYGYPADMLELDPLAQDNGLQIIEDAAQAIGASIAGRTTGSFGVGCFSLYATKNVTAGEGGVITTNDPDIASEVRLLRNQGMSGRYEYARVGFNARMTDVHAALAVPHLQRLEEINETRRSNAARLTDGLEGLPGITVPAVETDRYHVFHQYTLRCSSTELRDRIVHVLTQHRIGCGVIYPKVVYDYDCYRSHDRVVLDEVPVAERFVTEVVSLPVHPHLAAEDVDRVVSAVRSATVV